MISPAEISNDSAGSIVMMSSIAQAMTSVSFGVAASASGANAARGDGATAPPMPRNGEFFMVSPRFDEPRFEYTAGAKRRVRHFSARYEPPAGAPQGGDELAG